MNSKSDYDNIRTGTDAYQAFTTRTASVYREAPLIRGMRWNGRASIGLPMRDDTGPGVDAGSIMELGYTLGKLCGEAGEANEKFWKWMRDTKGTVAVQPGDSVVIPSEDVRQEIAKELGDVLWYVAQAARCLDISLGDVAIDNLEKLRSRASRGTLGGSGDER